MIETLLVIGTALAGVGTTGAAAFLIYRRPPRLFWPTLPILVGAASAWCLFEILTSVVVRDPDRYWVVLACFYTSIQIFVLCWWLMSLRYLRWLGVPLRGDTSVLTWLPVVGVAFAWLLMITNPLHGRFVLPVVDGYNEYRAFYFVHLAVLYAMLSGALAVHGYVRLTSREQHIRRPMSWVLFATCFPMVVNALYQFRVWPTTFDPTALAVGISGVIFAYAIYFDRLLVLVPVSFSKVFDHSPNALFMLDSNYNIVSWSRLADPFFYTDSRARYPSVWAAIAPALSWPDSPRSPVTSSELAEILRRPEAQEIGVPLRINDAIVDNGWKHVRLFLNPVPGRRGPVGYALRILDESPLESAREELRQQNAVLSGILASTGNAVVVTSADGTVVFSNRAFANGWSVEELDMVGLDSESLNSMLVQPLQDREAFRKTLENASNDPSGEFSGEIRFESGPLWTWHTRPLVQAATAQGRIWTFTDVTEARQFEAERRRLEQMMQQAQRLESLGVLAGGIAHDFNNLLTGIMGNIELAQRDCDPAVSELLDSALSSTNRAADLTHQMLAYSGQASFENEAVDVSALIGETLDLLGSQFSNNATIACDIEPNVWTTGDPTQLRQVIMNLLTNASDALDGTPGTISVRARTINVAEAFLAKPALEKHLPAGEYLEIRISDTGHGMSEQTVQRAFDPFFTTKFTGRGLGLAAVLGIVNTHGGSLDVESVTGEGSTFELRLPTIATDAPEMPATQRLVVPDASPPNGNGAATVLVVEDETPVRELICGFLDTSGYAVIAAENGRAGVELHAANAESIQLVVLDMTMPEMNGAEFFRIMRERTPMMPVVVMSGYTETFVLESLEGENSVSFLQKPFSMIELREAIAAGLTPKD